MINEFGASRRPARPTPEQLNELFTSQDKSKPVIFNPRPLTFVDLAKADLHTAKVIVCANNLTKLLNSNYEDLPYIPVFLAGGLASEIIAGQNDGTHSVYRKHHDVDLFVPKDQISKLRKEFKPFGGLDKAANFIYRTRVPVNYGSQSEILAPTVTNRPEIQVDLFAYQIKGNKATFSVGSYETLEFSLPSRRDMKICDLYDTNFYIHEELIRKMKELDAKTREKGKVDWERIQGK